MCFHLDPENFLIFNVYQTSSDKFEGETIVVSTSFRKLPILMLLNFSKLLGFREKFEGPGAQV